MVALNPFQPANLIIVKIGSSLLVDPETGTLKNDWLAALSNDIASLRQSGLRVAIVSSGAIALGRRRLGFTSARLTLSEKQACAAAGQTILTQAYEAALGKHDLNTAQILLTLNDTEDRRRWLNARGTLNTLLDLGVVPIINENDTVATDEIRYGDNDRLAARTAQMIGADTLILLSDIDGLYTSDPTKDDGAKHLPRIDTITEDIIAMGGGANSAAGVGSGGMATKIAAAAISVKAGCDMCITNGRINSPIQYLIKGAKSTWFKAAESPVAARRQWIAGHLNAKGEIKIDDGAAQALRSGKSLLAVGISAIDGKFDKGDAVIIKGQNGAEIARGLVSYSA